MTRSPRSWIRRAFTLLELLVVIVILAIVVAIAVPSFNALLYTSNQSGAANALQSAILAGRDAAIQSHPGSDGAAVFFFEPGGRVTVVPCVEVGVLQDEDLTHASLFVEREVFVPAPGVEPVELPINWLVSAFANYATLHEQTDHDTGWYDDASGNNSEIYGPSTSEVQQSHWIFPETGFYGREVHDSGHARQTFMFRFEGGTGRLNVADTEPVLVLDPTPRTTAFLSDPGMPKSMDDFRADLATNPRRFVDAVLAAPPQVGIGGGGGSQLKTLSREQKWELLGDMSVDTVLARPVGQVALYNVRRLAGAIGLRGINETTGCFFLPVEELDAPDSHAQWDTSLFGGLSPMTVRDRMYKWIEDRYYATPSPDPNDRTPSDARIFGIRRYDGSVIELTGSRLEN